MCRAQPQRAGENGSLCPAWLLGLVWALGDNFQIKLKRFGELFGTECQLQWHLIPTQDGPSDYYTIFSFCKGEQLIYPTESWS